MAYLFHILIGFGLLLVQTAVAPWMPFPGGFYDLQIPFLLYLVIFRPLGEAVFVALFMGAVVDSVSTTPFGFYGLAYQVIIAMGYWVLGFLHSLNRLLIPLFVALGVLLENLLMLGACLLPGAMARPPRDVSELILFQVTAALLTGYFILRGCHYLHRGWRGWMRTLFKSDDAGGEAF